VRVYNIQSYYSYSPYNTPYGYNYEYPYHHPYSHASVQPSASVSTVEDEDDDNDNDELAENVLLVLCAYLIILPSQNSIIDGVGDMFRGKRPRSDATVLQLQVALSAPTLKERNALITSLTKIAERGISYDNSPQLISREVTEACNLLLTNEDKWYAAALTRKCFDSRPYDVPDGVARRLADQTRATYEDVPQTTIKAAARFVQYVRGDVAAAAAAVAASTAAVVAAKNIGRSPLVDENYAPYSSSSPLSVRVTPSSSDLVVVSILVKMHKWSFYIDPENNDRLRYTLKDLLEDARAENGNRLLSAQIVWSPNEPCSPATTMMTSTGTGTGTSPSQSISEPIPRSRSLPRSVTKENLSRYFPAIRVLDEEDRRPRTDATVVQLQVALSTPTLKQRNALITSLIKIAERSNTDDVTSKMLSREVAETCKLLLSNEEKWYAGAIVREVFFKQLYEEPGGLAQQLADKTEAIYEDIPQSATKAASRFAQTLPAVANSRIFTAAAKLDDRFSSKDVNSQSSDLVVVSILVKMHKWCSDYLDPTDNYGLKTTLNRLREDGLADNGDSVQSVQILWSPNEPCSPTTTKASIGVDTNTGTDHRSVSKETLSVYFPDLVPLPLQVPLPASPPVEFLRSLRSLINSKF
jgi:Protein of unknown function (DUF1517)